MFFGGRDTGRPNFKPLSGLRALAGAFLARSPRALRSPLLWASTSARFVGTLASTACRSITLSPSTTPRRNPSLDSNPTIFMALEAPSCAEGRDYKKRRKARLYAYGTYIRVRFGPLRARTSQKSGRDRPVPCAHIRLEIWRPEHDHRLETQAGYGRRRQHRGARGGHGLGTRRQPISMPAAVAPLEGLLTADECEALAALYDNERSFRSTIVMARHGFGRGEYKYFAYPLPGIVAALRPALYAPLVPIANRWNEAMGIAVRYPATHADFIKRCHAAGQTRPTPLLLQVWRRRLQLPAPGSLWRARLPAAGGDPALGAGEGFHRRRIRADRAAAAHAVARRGGAAQARRRRGVRGPSPAGQGHARILSRHHAARRQPRCAPAIARPRASSSTTRSRTGHSVSRHA